MSNAPYTRVRRGSESKYNSHIFQNNLDVKYGMVPTSPERQGSSN